MKTSFTDTAAASTPIEISFKLAKDDLRRMIGKIKFAMSRDWTRPSLNGIFLHTVDVEGHTMLRAVATDGHRLARVEIPAPDGAAGFTSSLIPGGAALALGELAVAARNSAMCRFSASEAQFTFDEAGPHRTSLSTKFMDRKLYPDYSMIVPKVDSRIASVDTNDLQAAISNVATFDPTNGVDLRLNLYAGCMIISVLNTDLGLGSETIHSEYGGEPFETAIFSKYILDAAGAIDGNNVRFIFGTEQTSPVFVDDPDDLSMLHIIMPVKL